MVYPGVEGLDVHGDCLAAARRGAFETGPPRSPVLAIAALLLTGLVPGCLFLLRALLPDRGWLTALLGALLLFPLLGAAALAAAVRLGGRLAR